MRKYFWKHLTLAVATGGMLMQAPGCAEAATIVTGFASTVTAGGVLYLVFRVLE